MKQFDYNKYVKNNPLLKESDTMTEAKEPDFVIPANDAYDIDEEAEYMQGILEDAGIIAKCKAGIGEVEVHLNDKSQRSAAIQAIEDEGYETSEDSDW